MYDDDDYDESVETAAPEKDARNLVAGATEVDEDSLSDLLDEITNCWTCTPDGALFWSTNNIREALPPGLYKCLVTEKTGFAFQKIIVSTDDLIPLPDTASVNVVEEIKKFWGLKAAFKQRGFLHKRGVLMYGEPGSGKTASIQLLIQEVIKENGMAIYADDPHVLTSCLQMLRRIEPDRKVIVILEDFETLTDRQNRENEWLSVLDGEAQIDDVVFLATTNYIHMLDKRFTDRPSRFDLVTAVPMPSARARAVFLKHKEPSLTLEELKSWTTKTVGFSFAHLKEVIISVKCFGHGLDESIERLRAMQRRNLDQENLRYDPDAPGGRKQVGFNQSTANPVTDEDLDWDEVVGLIEK